jgi:TonB-linked SusC/RagA family outer membrane protein
MKKVSVGAIYGLSAKLKSELGIFKRPCLFFLIYFIYPSVFAQQSPALAEAKDLPVNSLVSGGTNLPGKSLKSSIKISPVLIGVKGQITDESAQPLEGASVLVKGTKNGVKTDVLGNFSIEAPGTSTLVISYVGFETMEVKVGNRMNIAIQLKPSVVSGEQVIVVGYGTQKKQSVVGAISQVSSDQLKRAGGVSDLSQALTGQLPGVSTITANGEPGGAETGGATSIFIRGQNTWNGGGPLILVDGVERAMNNVDVNEVESISVLKDASATAVFGVKGANGVILIKTKRGTAGKARLSFSYNATALTVSKLPDVMDSYDALMIRNEAIEREVVLNEASWSDYKPFDIVKRYKAPQTAEYAEIYPNVDWEKAMFKDFSISHRATVNLQGGTDFVKYFGSLAYTHEGDMFKHYDNGKGYKPNYNFDRLNFRSNLDFKITNTTKLNVNLAGFFSQKNNNYSFRSTSSNGINPDAWAAVYGMPPDAYLPQYSDGAWGWSFLLPIEALPNPVASLNNIGVRQRRATQLNSDFTLEQNLGFLTKGLTARVSLFYDNSILAEGGINDVNNTIKPSGGSNTRLRVIDADLYTGPGQNPAEYTTDLPIGGIGQFDWALQPLNLNQETILTGSTLRRTLYQVQLEYARKFNLHSLGATAVVRREENALGSEFKHFREDWIFRATYDYDTRYLLEMNGAYNGSEKFGPGYRFAFFPSVGLGWNVSNEKFFHVDWIDRLKFRGSMGLVGDDKGGGRWLYASQLAYGTRGRLDQNPNNLSPYTWYRESVVGNPDIHWEKALKSNYGVEVSLFRNMISASFDYFTEDRTDILLDGTSRLSIPPYFGAAPPSANIGHVRSKGHELEVKFDRGTRDFHYFATASYSHTENKIINKDDPPLLPAYQQAKGYAIGQTRTQVRSGFYNNWDDVYASVPTETNDLAKLPGYYNIIDFNGDGVIKASDDAVPFGYTEVPQNSYNLTVGASYKSVSLMVQLFGVDNVSRYVPLKNFNQFQDVVFSHVADYWSKSNQNATSFLPRWKTQGQNIGDYYVYNGSYLRLKTAELAYTFKNKWIQKAGMSSARLFINGQNLIFWSDLPDDREAAWSGGDASQGAYPTPKRYNLGVEFNF